jgi:hypothetical protein
MLTTRSESLFRLSDSTELRRRFVYFAAAKLS